VRPHLGPWGWEEFGIFDVEEKSSVKSQVAQCNFVSIRSVIQLEEGVAESRAPPRAVHGCKQRRGVGILDSCGRTSP